MPGGSNKKRTSSKKKKRQQQRAGASLGNETPALEINHITDEIGRCFCKEHRREVCHDCCLAFDMGNRYAEEGAGLRKKRTPVEEAAEEKAMLMFAQRGMEQMVPRPSEEIFRQNREREREVDAKLQKFEAAGEDVAAAMKRAIEAETGKEIEQQGMMQAWAKMNPGKTTWKVGGKETQRIYEQVAANPSSKGTRAESFTCSYCQKTSTTKLMACARCMRVSYCSKECQTVAWKAHKIECVKWEKARDPKTLDLTWEQVEAHAGSPVLGRTLEVRAVLDESMMRQVFQCKDRVGAIRRVAAYTSSRRIPGLKQGSVLRWKNPRFYFFMDGSSGARIEEEDLQDITVT